MMRRKVMWLFFWTTLAFWVGCTTSGENRNYEINQEDAPLFQEADPTMGASDVRGTGMPASDVVVIQVDPELPARQAARREQLAAQAPEQPVTEREVAPIPEPAPQPEELVVEESPAVELPVVDSPESPVVEKIAEVPAGVEVVGPAEPGLNREAWPVITISPDRGIVSHYPLYYHRLRLRQEHQSPLISPDADPTAQALLALNQAVDEQSIRTDAAEMLLAPLKAAWDTALLPAKMVITPPWTTEYSPDYAVE